MPPKYTHTDLNQGEILQGLLDAGYWAIDTHMVGCGYPDITVIIPGAIVALEVKQPGEKLRGKYEPGFHERAGAMYAPVFVVYTLEDALKRIGEVMRGR